MVAKKKDKPVSETEEKSVSETEQKRKISKAEILTPVNEIKAYMEKITKITDSLPECSFKNSLTISNKNYNKKLELFLSNTGNIFTVNEDEKNIIERYRKGEITIKEKE